MIIGGQPFVRQVDNYLQLMNEAMISCYLYLLMMLTDYNSVNPFKDLIAWIMLGSIFFNISVNLFKALFDFVVESAKHLKRKIAHYRRRKYKETLEIQESDTQEVATKQDQAAPVSKIALP